MNLSYRIYYVWKRNLFSYKRFVIPTLLVSLGEPLFYLITLGIGLGAYMGFLGGQSYLHFLAPGVIILAAMVSSAFECLYGSFVRMVHEKIYDSLIVTPILAEDIIAGEIAWGIFRGLISGLMMMIVAVLLKAVPFSLPSLIMILVLMIFVGFLFASLSMIITSFAPNFDFFNYYTELIITPMFFFSGVFFPFERFPSWVKILANFFPLTHATIISRSIFSGAFNFALILNFLTIAIPAVIFFIAALFFMKRRLIK